MSDTPKSRAKRSKPTRKSKVSLSLGRVFVFALGFLRSLTRNLIFTAAPFRRPTPRIASPRRDLAIRAAEGEIAEGLQQNDGKVNPTSPISGKK